jgi:hypothetical protein
VLLLACSTLIAACNRIDHGELSEARAEAEAARVELAKLRAEAEADKAELSRLRAKAEAKSGGPSNPEKKPSLEKAKSDLLTADQKGTSDGMEIEVVDVAKNTFGKLEIVVRITNPSQTVIKRPYFYFSVRDEFRNLYGIAPGHGGVSLYPGKSHDERHSFDTPVEKADYVILMVANRDGRHSDMIPFKIPKSKWTGNAK